MNIATWSFSTSGRSDLVVLISASALALMFGSTGKVMSLASSMGAGSERCSVKPSPCLQRDHFESWTASTILSNSLLQPLVVANVEVAGQQRLKPGRSSAWRRRGGPPGSWLVRLHIAFRPAQSARRPDQAGLGLRLGSWVCGRSCCAAGAVIVGSIRLCWKGGWAGSWAGWSRIRC